MEAELVTARLERLVTGLEPWCLPDDISARIRLARGYSVVVRQYPGSSVATAYLVRQLSDGERPACPPAEGPNLVEAVAALCCQDLAVALLHGVEAFPELDRPEPPWRYWFCSFSDWLRYLEVRRLADLLEWRHLDTHMWNRLTSPNTWKWRRAPAPSARLAVNR